MTAPTIHVRWEPDFGVDHVKEYDCYDEEPETCEVAYAYIRDPKTDERVILASLGCIDDADDDYRKVVEEELRQEAEQELLTGKWQL